MRIAFISPVEHLWSAHDTGYYMLLAQHVLRDPRWLKYYDTRRLPSSYLILDNGAAEDGLLSTAALRHAADLIKPDCLIVPDNLYSAKETIYLAKAFELALPGECTPMVVPHGETLSEWEDCLGELLEMYPQAVIGLAKRHTYQYPGSECIGRGVLITKCLQYYPSNRIHLLGIQGNPLECMLFSSIPNVMGVDTALPWVLAAQGLEFSEAGLLHRPDHWHSDESAAYSQGVITRASRNMRWMQRRLDAEENRQGYPGSRFMQRMSSVD